MDIEYVLSQRETMLHMQHFLALASSVMNTSIGDLDLIVKITMKYNAV